MDIPSGCRFRTRCPVAQAICAEQVPPDVDLGDGRVARCHFAHDVSSGERRT
jgi:oligopeptide/dipeptide ABC transporter ATP-binding protein